MFNNIKNIRILVSIFVLICLAILILINVIPRGNFLAAPIITLFIYAPFIIIQIFLLIQIWSIKNIENKFLKINFYISFVITLFFIFFFVRFLLTTS